MISYIVILAVGLIALGLVKLVINSFFPKEYTSTIFKVATAAWVIGMLSLVGVYELLYRSPMLKMYQETQRVDSIRSAAEKSVEIRVNDEVVVKETAETLKSKSEEAVRKARELNEATKQRFRELE